MEDDQSDLSERLLWLNNHFERLTTLVPAENLQARPELREEDEEEVAETTIPKHMKMSVIRTVVKSKSKGGQEEGKQELKMVKREALDPRRVKKKKKRKGIDREQIVRMIKKQRGGGDDSGVDSDGSVDLGKKETHETAVDIKKGAEMHVEKEVKSSQAASTSNTSKNHGNESVSLKTVKSGKAKKDGSQVGDILQNTVQEKSKESIKKKSPKVKVHSNNQSRDEQAATTERTKGVVVKSKTGKGGIIDSGEVAKKGHSKHREEVVSKNQSEEDSSSDDESSDDDDTLQIESTRTNSKRKDTKVSMKEEVLLKGKLLFEQSESSSDDSSEEEVEENKRKGLKDKEQTSRKTKAHQQEEDDVEDTVEDIADMASSSEDESSEEERIDDGETKSQGMDGGNEEDAEMSFNWSGSENDEDQEGWAVEKKKGIKKVPGQPRDPDLREKMRVRREELKTERVGKEGRKKENLKKVREEIKQMRREKKKATTEARRDLKQYLKGKKKEDDEGEGSIQFSKLKFESDSLVKKPPKKTKNMVERQTGKNFKVLINKAERKKEKYEKLKETDPDKAVDWLSNEKWRKAVLQAEGAKIKDDPELLKKSLKRAEKRKERSRNKMKAIKDKEEQDQKHRQNKRTRNIKERRQKKVAAKVKRLQRKGKLLMEDRDKIEKD